MLKPNVLSDVRIIERMGQTVKPKLPCYGLADRAGAGEPGVRRLGPPSRGGAGDPLPLAQAEELWHDFSRRSADRCGNDRRACRPVLRRGDAMIRILYRPQDKPPRFDLAPHEVPAALADPQGLVWMDFQAEPPEVCEPILRQTFGFHPLAVDDALQESHVPKVDDWSEYVYLVLPAIVLGGGGEPHIEILELDAFLGSNYLVTHHDQPIAVVDRVWSSCQRDERHLEGDVDHVLYRLVDELAASYMAVIEQLDDAIELVEDEVFDKPTTSTLQRIFALKRALIQLRRIIVPQREVLNRLARGDYAVVDAKDRVFFRDVYDHLVRMHDITESMRDLVAGSLDTYLSVINNRMNDIMKTLTIITTLFMPLTFLTGFFGMNFFGPSARLDAWTGVPALVITLLILLATPLAMYFWMKRQGWSRGWNQGTRR